MNTKGSIKPVGFSDDYDDEFDDEDDDDFLSDSEEKIKKDKKKKKKKNKEKSLNGTPRNSGVKQLLAGLNNRQTKNNWNNTALKTVVDLLGIGLGTTVSATTGKAAPLIAAALIGTGHYIGDESGLLRIIGASTLSHSVAKAKEYREQAEMSVADRLKGLKDDWLYAAMLKQIDEQQKAKDTTPVVTPTPPEPIITQSDLDGLDLYSCLPEYREERDQILRDYEQLNNEQPENPQDYEDDELGNYEEEEFEEDEGNENEYHSQPTSFYRNDSSDQPSDYRYKRDNSRKNNHKGYYSQEEINEMLYGDLPDMSLL